MSHGGRKSLSSFSIFCNRIDSSRIVADSLQTGGSPLIRDVCSSRIWSVGLRCSGGSSLIAFSLLNLIAQLIHFVLTK
jgi:hypothetical protein